MVAQILLGDFRTAAAADNLAVLALFFALMLEDLGEGALKITNWVVSTLNLSFVQKPFNVDSFQLVELSTRH